MALSKGSYCHLNHGLEVSEVHVTDGKSAKSLLRASLGEQLGRGLLLISTGTSFPGG